MTRVSSQPLCTPVQQRRELDHIMRMQRLREELDERLETVRLICEWEAQERRRKENHRARMKRMQKKNDVHTV